MSLSSKYSTGNHSITPYWDGQHSRSSWRFDTTPTSSSRCHDQRESSQSTEASSNQINVTVTFTKSPTHSEPNKNSIAMVTDKSTFPLVSRSESKEYGRDFSIDSDTVTHQVHPTDPDKTVRVYAHLPEEQATALVAFLRDDGKYSPSAQPTCLEYHANSWSTPYASNK